MRQVLFAALLCSSATADPKCVPLAEARATAAANEQANAKRFAAALAAKKLKPVVVASTQLPESTPGKEGTVATHRIDGKSTRVLLGSRGSTCSRSDWELVQDERGALFHVIRKPRPVGRGITACACTEYAPACGGPPTRFFRVGYVLGQASYKGTVEIEYEAASGLAFSGQDPRGGPCVPQPPAP